MVDRTGVPLIPRKTFFENANAVNPKLSPDGRWLTWIAAVEGVMNVWVAPSNAPTKSRTLTRQADRPIFELWFARTSAHVLFLKDKGGDENYHLWCAGLDGLDAQDLTPYRDVLANLVGFHYDDPNLIAVGMNDRDSRWHDFYTVDIRTGERQLLYDNRDEITSLILDSRLNLRLATTTRNKGRGSAILKWNGIGFEEIISIEADDALCTGPSHCQSCWRRLVPSQHHRARQGSDHACRLEDGR
jgi:hypothetical protein